jgi:hypothetical protein
MAYLEEAAATPVTGYTVVRPDQLSEKLSHFIQKCMEGIQMYTNEGFRDFLALHHKGFLTGWKCTFHDFIRMCPNPDPTGA